MTDAHCHVTGGDPTVREFLIGRDFIGVHPWESGEAESFPLRSSGIARFFTSGKDSASPLFAIDAIREALAVNPLLGVGEIGLDRLKEREISPRMRELFEAQLKLALEFRRPVVLHGAKCWGQVVKTIANCELRITSETADGNSQFAIRNSSFLFHGFSRSDGLIPDIVALNGYISVGPAVLNDHAVNYRELVKKIPLDRMLLETDRTEATAAECPSVRDVAAKVAELRGLAVAELESITDRNADNFAIIL